MTQPESKSLPSEDPDLPIIEQVLAGDASAFGTLVSRHERDLRRLLLGVVSDRDQVEDVLQDSFLIAYRQLATFRRNARFKTWLFRISVREGMRARHRLRRIWHAVMPTEDTHLNQEEGAAPQPGKAFEDLEFAQSLLSGLPDKERAAFVMFAEGWSHQEISATLSSPMGTVASWIHRAKNRLAVVVQESASETSSEGGTGQSTKRSADARLWKHA